jgi:hypothetical protein
MAQPETKFRLSVERHLPKTLHREKMANPYRGGTADSWYSGTLADLWVEWKFILLPKRESTTVLPPLSPKQNDWLSKRRAEGRRVAVVLGCEEGGVMFVHGSWNHPHTTGELRSLMLTRREIAAWIERVTCAGVDVSWRPQTSAVRPTEPLSIQS